MGHRAYACNLSTKQMPGTAQTLTQGKQSLCVVASMQLAESQLSPSALQCHPLSCCPVLGSDSRASSRWRGCSPAQTTALAWLADAGPQAELLLGMGGWPGEQMMPTQVTPAIRALPCG